ncbi:MAG: energy transducer TonB, partial [Parabacteroides sp.]|nr:energy transducer TonB [Parabacteroides sp.]
HVDRVVTYLSNNFNMSHLKNRIQMMNKKRTPRMERMKYLIFVPLITILLIVSNIDTLARFTGTL